jgi:hypothetical protein
MKRQADDDVEHGKKAKHLPPAKVLMQQRRQWPEQGRGKACDQGEMGNAAARAAELDDRHECRAVEHETRGELHCEDA